jgi:hypothetical protein
MDLKTYLAKRDREEFARKIGTTKNYINNLCQQAAFPGRKLALKIEQETGGAVSIRDLLFPIENTSEMQGGIHAKVRRY